MGSYFSKASPANDEAYEGVMADAPKLVVPTRIEAKFALQDGSEGSSIEDAYSFSLGKVDNLYSWDENAKEFTLDFTEKGVAYDETDASTQQVKVTLTLEGSADFKLAFDPTPVEAWGINFVGVVRVRRDGKQERLIYIPGTRTYDPAGISGDPHASERIGPSCSRTQCAITLAELVAGLHGAGVAQLTQMQEQLLPLVTRYHGRQALFQWMLTQIQDTVFSNKDATPYPEFIKNLISSGKLQLTDARKHTRLYLASYNAGRPRPPTQYYKKVGAKDNVSELFNDEEMEKFKVLSEQ